MWTLYLQICLSYIFCSYVPYIASWGMLIDAVPSFTWNSINKQGIEKLMVPILYHTEFYQVVKYLWWKQNLYFLWFCGELCLKSTSRQFVGLGKEMLQLYWMFISVQAVIQWIAWILEVICKQETSGKQSIMI